jgi:hypothetical protein
MLYRFVHDRIDFVFRDIADLLGATVQQCFELRNDSGFTFRWPNPLWWNGHNADLFVSPKRTAEDLFNGGLERARHLTSFLNGHVLH